MMIATLMAIILTVLCPLISAIPAYAPSPLVQHIEQCTHALSTFVQFVNTTPWLDRTSDAVHKYTTQPVSAETSLIVYDTTTGGTDLIVYDTTKTEWTPWTCPASSKPSRAATEVLLTIEGPVAGQASHIVDEASKTQSTSTNDHIPVGTSKFTTVVHLTIGGPISTKADGKGIANTTLPTHLAMPICAASSIDGQSSTNKIIMIPDQQPDPLSSDHETTLAPQGFRLFPLLDYCKSCTNNRDAKANVRQSL